MGLIAMKRKAAILAILMLVVFLLAAAIVFLHQRHAPEPVYEGKRAMEWALEFQHPIPARREEAGKVLLQFDESALPALIRALEKEPAFLQKAYLKHQEKIPKRLRRPLLRVLKPHDPGLRRLAAARAIPRLPFCAIQTVPALRKLLYSSDGFLSYNAAVALVASGKEPGMQALIAALDSPVHQTRLAASSALAGAPAQAHAAIPALINRFQDSAQLASQAAYTLGRIGSPALPAILEALDHPDPRARQHALRALTSMHDDARPALAKLLAMSKDDSPAVRTGALLALKTTSPTNRKAIQAAITALDDPETEVRLAALHLLAQAPTAAGPGFPSLIEILKNDPPELSVLALRILPRLDVGTETAVPVLQQLADHPDPEVRMLAEAALTAWKEN
jgi:HEAT repeat protein